MYHRLTDAIAEARRRVRAERRTISVYRRNGKLAVLPLEDCLNADLWDHGAKLICSFTLNSKGKIV
jgi:hypothetical protein